MLNIFGYQVCVIQVRVINISFGSISLSVLLGTFGIMQNGGKPYKIYVPNSVEMHLLNDCEDLVFMQCKLVSDVIDRMQTNLSQETPYLANFLKIIMT